MALTKYVSAQWVEPPFPGGKPMIKAIGDDDVEYWIPDENTDVPPWPAFKKSGVTIKDADPPPDAA